MPRLIGHEWDSPTSDPWAFLVTVTGIGLDRRVVGLGGFVQGLGLEDAKVPCSSIADFLYPFLLVQPVWRHASWRRATYA